MTIRFFRRLAIAPGVTLNLSKRGMSVSAGVRGARITAGTSGVRRTIGLPGTGLWYTEHTSAGKRAGARSRTRARRSPPPQPARSAHRLNLGFFRRLVTPKDEEDFVDGMRHLVAGDEDKAREHLARAAHLADAAFAAGILALRHERFDDARRHLTAARRRHASLGRHFAKYGIDATARIRITERIAAEIAPCPRGVLLALAEVHQARGDWKRVVDDLRALHRRAPEDPVVLLSLCEMLVEECGGKPAMKEVVRLTRDVENTSQEHAAVLLWKGKALRALGVLAGARDTLTAALRRRKDRSDELLRAIRYERALVYEALGQRARARRELETIYAEAPAHEDVAQRLGI